MAADLIARARAGDGEAFRELTEPCRRELQVHSYRMLGSIQDAEDAVQDTLLAAWQGLGGFEERPSVRTWLYRIATSQCLNALRSASRRLAKEWNIPGVAPPEPTRLSEIVWLEPFPGSLLRRSPGCRPGRAVTAAMAASGVARLVATSSYAMVATRPYVLAPWCGRSSARRSPTRHPLTRSSGPPASTGPSCAAAGSPPFPPRGRRG